MTKITKETVEHVAKLASLKFSPDQLSIYTQKFSHIIEYIEKLNELDTKGVEPTSHAVENFICPMRKDEAVKFNDVEGILKNAPKTHNRLVEVPKVIEND